MTSTNRNSPPLTVVTTTPGSTQRQRTRPPQSACPQLWTAPPANPAQYATTIMASSNTSMSRPVLTNYKSTPAPSVAVSIHQSQQLQQQQLNSVVQEEEGEINPPVDAALLSALRDPRERVALLRLEQKLVEFANDPTLTQVEVGPGNGDSVVNNLAPTSSTSSGTAEVEPNSGTSTSNAINRELQNMNLRTSFHRKCLHKLADRFRISRETTENNAIRLMKGVDSRVPNKLLIDLPIENGCMSNGRSIHTNQPNAQTGTVNGIIPISGGPVAPNGIVSSSHAPQDRIGETNNSIIPITDGLSSIQLSSHGGGGGKKSRKKEKIKIFKRSMAQKGSSGNLSMKDGSNGDMNGSNSNRRKKNLGDKEKAYAEARARIFNSSSENSTNKSNSAAQVNNTDDLPYDRGHSDHTTPHTAAVAVPNYQDTNGTFITTTGDRKCPPHSAALGEFYTASPQTFSPVSDAPPPYSSSSVTTSTTATSTTPSSASLHFCTLANAISTEPASAISANGPTTKNRASNSAPAAVTSGAASKVTWRNRQQEASDPDFQRGVHVVGGLGVPMTAVAPSAAPYHYHSNHHQHPTSSAHQCGVMPSVGAGMVHNLINGYHYPTLGVGGVGAVPGNTGSGGGVLDLSAYHHGEPASSWQRQDDGIGCGVTATAVHQSQQIPPVIFSSPTPSAHHGQYQVLSQQHQYTSSIGLPLSGSSADSGSMSITTNQQRHGTDPLLGDPSGSSSRTRLVYTAEDFPALG